MQGRTAEVVLTDSGFWLALCDPYDEHHQDAVSIKGFIEPMRSLVPWPVLYESFSTRTVRRPALAGQFTNLLAFDGVIVLDDKPYRRRALDSVKAGVEQASLADAVLRRMILDQDLQVEFFVSFNQSDFRDVCDRRGIPILPRDL